MKMPLEIDERLIWKHSSNVLLACRQGNRRRIKAAIAEAVDEFAKVTQDKGATVEYATRLHGKLSNFYAAGRRLEQDGNSLNQALQDLDQEIALLGS